MKRTILLADDSPTIQRLVTQTFADSDYAIVSVSNGDAAIRKLDEIQPDIVLADIYMPGKNGYEVCAYVRAHAQLSRTPVVLLAGAFDAFNQEIADNAGATAHIKKPFEPRALVSLVVSIVPPGGERTSRPAEPDAIPEPVMAAPAAVAGVLPQAPPVTVPEDIAASAQTVEDRPVESGNNEDKTDIMGLEALFKAPGLPATLTVSDEEIERIAQRVIQRISKETIESVAWDVVPDIASQVLREELKRNS